MRNVHVVAILCLADCWVGLGQHCSGSPGQPGLVLGSRPSDGEEKDLQLPFIISHEGNDTIKVVIEYVLTVPSAKSGERFQDLPMLVGCASSPQIRSHSAKAR